MHKPLFDCLKVDSNYKWMRSRTMLTYGSSRNACWLKLRLCLCLGHHPKVPQLPHLQSRSSKWTSMFRLNQPSRMTRPRAQQLRCQRCHAYSFEVTLAAKRGRAVNGHMAEKKWRTKTAFAGFVVAQNIASLSAGSRAAATNLLPVWWRTWKWKFKWWWKSKCFHQGNCQTSFSGKRTWWSRYKLNSSCNFLSSNG